MQAPADFNYFAALPQELKKKILLQLVTLPEINIPNKYKIDIKYYISDLRNVAFSCNNLYKYFMNDANFNREAFEKMYTQLPNLVSEKAQAQDLLNNGRIIPLRENERKLFDLSLKIQTLIALGTSQAKLFFDEQCMQGKTATEIGLNLLQLLINACSRLSSISYPGFNKHQCTPIEITEYKTDLAKERYTINKLIQWLGADVNMIVDSNNSSLLMHATKTLNKRCVKLLLSKGASINLKDKEGNTALLVAILALKDEQYINYQSFLKLVSLFIDAGANVNDSNTKGFTPLHYTLMSSFSSSLSVAETSRGIAKVLIEKGANCDFRPRGSLESGQPLETPYQFVCRKHTYEEDNHTKRDWAHLKDLMEKQQADKKWCVIQ